MTILSSLLNDVQTEGDKVKLTVMWGEQTLLRNQLLQQQEHNQEANCHALEAALLRRAHLSVHRKGKAQSLGHQNARSQHATPVVTTLIGFVPDPRFVSGAASSNQATATPSADSDSRPCRCGWTISLQRHSTATASSSICGRARRPINVGSDGALHQASRGRLSMSHLPPDAASCRRAALHPKASSLSRRGAAALSPMTLLRPSPRPRRPPRTTHAAHGAARRVDPIHPD